MVSEEKTIFKRIIDGEIPANLVYEDDLCLAFHDVSPQAPTHVLLIPKREVVNVAGLTEEDRELAGHLLLTAGKIARELGIEESGYRVVANCGRDGVNPWTIYISTFSLAGRLNGRQARIEKSVGLNPALSRFFSI